MKNHAVNFKSRKEWEDFMWNKIVESLRGVKRKSELENILRCLVSINEQKLMINRVAAVSLIRARMSYRQIGEMLWLSPSTISAIKKSLLSREYYKSPRNRRKNKEDERAQTQSERPRSFFEDFEKLFTNFPPPPTKSGRGRWAFLSHPRYNLNG